MINSKRVINNILSKRKISKDKHSKGMEGMGVTNDEIRAMKQQMPNAPIENIIYAIKKNKAMYMQDEWSQKV